MPEDMARPQQMAIFVPGLALGLTQEATRYRNYGTLPSPGR